MMDTAVQDGVQAAAAVRLRLVTAAGLFDGNDAALHIMRRLIQAHAAEVIHLGHHRSVDDVVRAALQEDADAVVVSSQRGGHVEYFTYLVDLLNARGAGHVLVFAISLERFPDDDIAALEACGVACIYDTPADAPAALAQMVDDLMARARRAREGANRPALESPAESAPALRPSGTPSGYATNLPPAATPAADAAPINTPPPWWPGASSPPAAPAVPAVPVNLGEIRWQFGALGQPGRALPITPAPQSHSPLAPDLSSMLRAAPNPAPATPPSPTLATPHPLEQVIARRLSLLENAPPAGEGFHDLRKTPPMMAAGAPVIGMTGTGGAGKSSVMDELLMRFLACFPEMRIAVLSVDPTRRRSGGALLGDRIRMNALRSPRVYMRSMATRRQNMATSTVLQDCIQYLKGQDFDLVMVETAGIGQSDSTIVDLVDLPVYVMTSDYGAPSQLEKIDMLDFAELIILNKYDQRGATDALRDIRQQWRRNRQAYDLAEDQIPVYPTIASQCNDAGMNWMFVNLCRLLRSRQKARAPAPHPPRCDFNPQLAISEKLPDTASLIPPRRSAYLAEIAEQGRAIQAHIQSQAQALTRAQQCWQALDELNDPARPEALSPYPLAALNDAAVDAGVRQLRQCYHDAMSALSPQMLQRLREWQHQHADMTAEPPAPTADLGVRAIPTIATPRYTDWGDALRFLARENLPGEYPYTSGIQTHPAHSTAQARLLADQGTPERANRQWHLARAGHREICLVSHFDSVTLYGEDPDERLDIQGKIGHDGVNVPTLDAMKKLYSGFDLCAPEISVLMRANGPAPILAAMFIQTAIDQQVERWLQQDAQRWHAAQQAMEAQFRWRPRPDYDAELPPGHTALGLGLLGISGEQLVDADTYARIKADTLSRLRGRVQVDILEQEQAGNPCIFSPEFSLRMLGDVQRYCAEHGIRHFHAASVSSLNFAERGAAPITQLAFALANGLTLVEYALARGLHIDQIAPAMRFFLAIGDDLEYSVQGRVARRIWARAMRERYGAHPDHQKFQSESHPQTHALHTILEKELGVDVCQAPWQGSFVIDALTDLVEEAVYREFEALNTRGGVLGAMNSLYQRDRIEEEWMQRMRKLSASGNASALSTAPDTAHTPREPLTRAEKTRQIASVQLWNGLRNGLPPDDGLAHLQHAAHGHGNLFAALLEAVKTHSLGQITRALYAAGGEYRRTL